MTVAAIAVLWGLESIPAQGVLSFMNNPWIRGALQAVCISVAIVAMYDRIRWASISSATLLAVLLGVVAIATSWIGDGSWIVPLATMAAIGTVALLTTATALPYVVIVAGIAAPLCAAFGDSNAILGALVLSVILLAMHTHASMGSDGRSPARDGRSGFDLTPVGAALDRIVLTPCLGFLLALTRRLPFRRTHFLSFAREAVLLQQSGAETEFTHRLLRDYFALRELLPRVSSSHHDRLETIRSLGYQGESALDVLHDLSTDIDPRVRAAAIIGLSHISSPVVLRYLAARVSDFNIEVRQALVSALCLMDEPNLLLYIRPLGDGSEIEALFSQEAGRRPADDHIYTFIRRIGDPGLQPLVRYLRSGNEWQRKRAADLLAALNSSAAEAELIR
ncbi:MAG: HEAT repeat domain-containing protein, partial [Steroidobacteraceae bacterium]